MCVCGWLVVCLCLCCFFVDLLGCSLCVCVVYLLICQTVRLGDCVLVGWLALCAVCLVHKRTTMRAAAEEEGLRSLQAIMRP